MSIIPRRLVLIHALEASISEVRRIAFAEARTRDAEARPFDCKLEILGDLFLPSFPTPRLLPTVEGGVDLDRGELARRIFKLFRLRELVRVEDPAPGWISPAADADAD